MARSRGAALDYLARKFGGLLRVLPDTTTVGTSVTAVYGNDSERVLAVFHNLGSSDMYIAPHEDVSSAKGILLSANGGLVSVDIERDGVLPTQAWWAIGDAAGLTLYHQEVRREVPLSEEE